MSMGYVTFLTNTSIEKARQDVADPAEPARQRRSIQREPSSISNQRWPCGNKPPIQFSSDCSVGGRLSISVYSPSSDYSL